MIRLPSSTSSQCCLCQSSQVERTSRRGLCAICGTRWISSPEFGGAYRGDWAVDAAWKSWVSAQVHAVEQRQPFATTHAEPE